MKKGIIVLLFALSNITGMSYSQELVGTKITIKDAWDNVFRSSDDGRNYELIGTYRGWNKDAIYIAGYNNQNVPSYYSTKYVSFGGAGVERLWVDLLSGNVGVGTINPQSPFHIKASTGYGSVRISPISDNAESSMGFFSDANGTSNSTAWVVGNSAWGNTGKFIIGNQTAGGPIIIAQQNGYVGIGTTNPDEKLTVNGVIHAREVKVDLSGPLADFVFKPNYKLMSLPQVEQFIKTNNYLPQMPSAEEVAKNGLSMGEMQNKLLQKVEELTLYAIQQNSKLQDQGQKLLDQEKKNKELELELKALKEVVTKNSIGCK